MFLLANASLICNIGLSTMYTIRCTRGLSAILEIPQVPSGGEITAPPEDAGFAGVSRIRTPAR